MKKSLQVLSLALLVSASLVADEAAANTTTETRAIIEAKKDVAMDAAAFTKALADAIDAVVKKHENDFKDLSNEDLTIRKAKIVAALLEGASELTTTTAQRKYIEEKVDAKTLLEFEEETKKATEVAA